MRIVRARRPEGAAAATVFEAVNGFILDVDETDAWIYYRDAVNPITDIIAVGRETLGLASFDPDADGTPRWRVPALSDQVAVIAYLGDGTKCILDTARGSCERHDNIFVEVLLRDGSKIHVPAGIQVLIAAARLLQALSRAAGRVPELAKWAAASIAAVAGYTYADARRLEAEYYASLAEALRIAASSGDPALVREVSAVAVPVEATRESGEPVAAKIANALEALARLAPPLILLLVVLSIIRALRGR